MYNFFDYEDFYFINCVLSNKFHRQREQNSKDISARFVQGNIVLTYMAIAANSSQ